MKACCPKTQDGWTNLNYHLLTDLNYSFVFFSLIDFFITIVSFIVSQKKSNFSCSRLTILRGKTFIFVNTIKVPHKEITLMQVC